MAGSPTIASLFAQRIVVGVADFAVANQAQMIISTYALGSCIGLVAYDSSVQVGGLLHLMLPESSLSPEKAGTQPAMFADTGIPLLFNALAGMRAQRSRTQIYIAGGASVLSGPDSFKIGERNIIAVKKMLAVYGCRVVGSEVAGTVNRTLHLEVGTGQLSIKLPDRTLAISLA
ncbi:MAG: chemotaxis protein CheD [Verrucomicrobia bacterium]|nr:chemotaxis protein CheD [Verrucomicrobiota bacterium]